MMRRDDWRSGSDEGLEKLLAAASRELVEEEFTSGVMTLVRRSARRRRLRAWVIGAALATGVLLALGPLVGLGTLAWSAARTFAWHDAGLFSQVVAETRMYPVPVLALLCMLVWPLFARWVAR
jgi:hypothetical protein